MWITVRNWAVCQLPHSIQQRMRRWHYPRKVAHYTENQWYLSAGVRRLIIPGSVAVDVGANVGFVTALLSKWVGPAGVVHSFEPVPDTFDVLAHTVAKLRLSNVRLHPCALSDRIGEALMRIPLFADGRENLYESSLEFGRQASSFSEIPVKTSTLDREIPDDISRVSFVKIDVEGHEERVLRGADLVLRASRPALLVEIEGSLDDPSAPAGRIQGFLSRLGYRAFFWQNGWRERRPGESAVDYFFLLPHHLEA